MNQAKVAELAGITQAMVSKIESGKDVLLSTLQAVAKVLDLHITAVTDEQAFQLLPLLNLDKANPTLKKKVKTFLFFMKIISI